MADKILKMTAEQIDALQTNQELMNGFDNVTNVNFGDIAFDAPTRTFSITVAGGDTSFDFWCKGVLFSKTSTESIQIPDVTGSYYFYYNNLGVLGYLELASVTAQTIYENAICGGCYYNATTGDARGFEERHGYVMDAATHAYNHVTFGARFSNGFNPVGLAVNGTTYTNVGSGVYYDEDIMHINALATAHSYMYRDGAEGAWVIAGSDNELGVTQGGDTYQSWNENTSGDIWQLTEMGNATDYGILFFLAMPAIGGALVTKLLPQNAYSSRLNARNAIESEKAKIKLDGLPSPEFIFLYAVIVKRDGKLQAIDGDSTLFLDFRTESGASAGSSVDTSDFLSKSETADQGIASNVALATGKRLSQNGVDLIEQSALNPLPTMFADEATALAATALDDTIIGFW